MSLTNKELQDVLNEYPDDYPVVVGIWYEGNFGVFTDITVDGASVHDIKLIVINSKNLDEEYKGFLDGKDEGCVFKWKKNLL